MPVAAIMETTGMRRNPLELLLGRMAKEGEIKRVGMGVYADKDYTPPSAPDAKPSRKHGANGSVASVSSVASPRGVQTDRQKQQVAITAHAYNGMEEVSRRRNRGYPLVARPH